MSIPPGVSNRAAFNTNNLIWHIKTKHSTEYKEFTQVTQAKSAMKQNCHVTEAKTDAIADF